jgi:hypothetical protein
VGKADNSEDRGWRMEEVGKENNSKSLFRFVEETNYANLIGFEDFLMQLSITKDGHIRLLQSTLKQLTIFHGLMSFFIGPFYY